MGEYGSLDAVIANAERVGGKIGENLRKALAHLPLSRQLATIRTDVPLDGGPETLHLRERDVDALRALYRRYEFNAALKELDAATGAASVGPGAPGAGPTAGGPPTGERTRTGRRAGRRRRRFPPKRWPRRRPHRARPPSTRASSAPASMNS